MMTELFLKSKSLNVHNAFLYLSPIPRLYSDYYASIPVIYSTISVTDISGHINGWNLDHKEPIADGDGFLVD